jgi:MFS family permease
MQPPTPARAQRMVQFLFWVQLISMGAMEMSGPFWPLHLRRLAGSEALFTLASVLVYVGPMLGIMLTASFWGRIGDRMGHKPMMVRALLGLALTQFALAWTSDVATILLLRFVQGACAGYIAPAQAYGVAVAPPDRRARLFALLQVSTNVGSLAGAVAGGLILDHASFFWINVGASVLCAACALAVVLVLPHVPPQPRQAAAPVAARAGSLCRQPPLPGLLAVLGLLLLSRMLTQMPFSLYVSAVFQAPHWVVGLCYGLLALGFVVSASLWARHFEGRGPQDALARLTAIAIACAALTAVAGITRSVAVFAGAYFLWGALLGATTPVLTSLVSRSVDAARQGQVLGLTQGVSQFSAVAGIALGGLFTQWMGLPSIYFFVAAAYCVAAWLTWVLRARHAVAAGAAPGDVAIPPSR